jgi:hypothetical protein
VEVHLPADLALAVLFDCPELGLQVLVIDDEKLALEFVVGEGGVYSQIVGSDNERTIEGSSVEFAHKVCISVQEDQ